MRVSLSVLVVLLACEIPAMAVPIGINAILAGDPRVGNPDDINLLVSITGDTTSNLTSWTVDLDMAATHPTARLGEFGFNLLGAASDYTIGGLSLPYSIDTNDNLQGSGNASFLFTLTNPAGMVNDATNAVSLFFTVTKNTGNFSLSDFLQAGSSCSNDNVLGCGQLGAHVLALNAGQGESDSGVALGTYEGEPTTVPEPSGLLLFATGLAFAARRCFLRSRSRGF